MAADEIYDIAIIGGGINGTGIAMDAALRGLSVILCEQNDLASGTSSASSKLIHGGLRYLEHHEYRLVKEGLIERERLLKNARHLVKPLNFILPHQPKLRSRLLIRLGLFLYDHLSKLSILSKTKTIKLQNHPAGDILKPDYCLAFQYSDCIADDARLVISNALKANQCGAEIFTYTECITAKRQNSYWLLTLKDKLSGEIFNKKSRVLINAAGPFVEKFLKDVAKINSHNRMSLVKGSHIVVPKLYSDKFAFILQNDDQRIIFIIPYLNHYTLIGTTDVNQSSPFNPQIEQYEIDYLISAVNKYLKSPIKKTDILHTFSGIRPLLKSNANNPAEITRDYAIELDGHNLPPLFSIFGGKLTTYRALSEKVVDKLKSFFPNLATSTTSETTLPGGDFNNDNELIAAIQQRFPWLEKEMILRYVNQFGSDTYQLLDHCEKEEDLGEHFGANLYQREIDYFISHEWAKNADDILWRRTQLGYGFPKENVSLLEKYIQHYLNTKT